MGSFNNSYQILCTKRDLSGWIKNPVIWNSAGKADKNKSVNSIFHYEHLIDLHGSNREVKCDMWSKQKVKKQNLEISQKYFVQEVERGVNRPFLL